MNKTGMPDGASSKEDALFVGSVEKACRVLEAFGTIRRDLGLSDIIERTGLNKSAAQRFTHTLHRLGYIEKDPATRRYMLSSRVLEAAHNFLTVDPLVSRATPHIVELRRQLNVRVGIGCLYGSHCMYLIPLQSNRTAFKTAHPGFKVPLHCTSSGQVLLAYQEEKEARALVERSDRRQFTPMTLTDVDEIMAKIAMIRSLGYSITDQEFKMGDINAATPVFDEEGNVVASVATAGSKSEWSKEAMESTVVPMIMGVAQAISISG